MIMTFFDMVNPESTLSYVLHAYTNGELTVEQCNEIGMNMPEGHRFQFNLNEFDDEFGEVQDHDDDEFGDEY